MVPDSERFQLCHAISAADAERFVFSTMMVTVLLTFLITYVVLTDFTADGERRTRRRRKDDDKSGKEGRKEHSTIFHIASATIHNRTPDTASECVNSTASTAKEEPEPADETKNATEPEVPLSGNTTLASSNNIEAATNIPNLLKILLPFRSGDETAKAKLSPPSGEIIFEKLKSKNVSFNSLMDRIFVEECPAGMEVTVKRSDGRSIWGYRGFKMFVHAEDSRTRHENKLREDITIEVLGWEGSLTERRFVPRNLLMARRQEGLRKRQNLVSLLNKWCNLFKNKVMTSISQVRPGVYVVPLNGSPLHSTAQLMKLLLVSPRTLTSMPNRAVDMRLSYLASYYHIDIRALSDVI